MQPTSSPAAGLSPAPGLPDKTRPAAPLSLTDGKSWTEFAGLQKLAKQLPQGVRDACTTCLSQVNQLNTAQKVAAVAGIGLGYLAFRAATKAPSPAARHDQQTWPGASHNAYPSHTATDDAPDTRIDRNIGNHYP